MSSRMQEVLAMLLIGDGVIGLLQPERHARLWKHGPTQYRRVMEQFVRQPGVTQFLGAVEVGLGIWWASKQHAR